MVNFSTIAIIGGLGLLIFFQKDVGKFLDQFKGFGENFGAVNLPDININVPNFPTLPDIDLPDVGGAIFDAGKSARQVTDKIAIDVSQFGQDVQTNIATALDEAGKTFDLGIKETQKNFEQFGQDVQTNIGIIGTGITEFVGGLFPAPKTTVSQTTPSIVTTSRRTGTTTRFGGQTAPKEILTPTTATTGTGTTTDPFKAQQPDPSLVSPFLSKFRDPTKGLVQTSLGLVDPNKVPENFFQGLISSRRSGTTGGR